MENKSIVKIEQSRAFAEVQASFLLARRFPRDEQLAYERMRSAMERMDEKTALYDFPRAGGRVKGPSIRMVEQLARIWGNLEFDIMELSRGDGVTEMVAYAWDLEAGVKSKQTFAVEHYRDTKRGPQKLSTQRDIYELTANLGARRLRARILSLLPTDYVEEAVRIVSNKQESDVKDVPTAVDKLLKVFAELEINKRDIEKYIGRGTSDFVAADIIRLRGVYASINEDMASPADYFPRLQKELPAPADDLNDELGL